MKITKVLCIIFVVAIVVLVGLGILDAFTLQSDFDNEKKDRYEQMLIKDGKAILTENTLNEDHRLVADYSDKVEEYIDRLHMESVIVCICWCGLLALAFIGVIVKRKQFTFLTNFGKSIVILALLAGSVYGTKLAYENKDAISKIPKVPNFDYVKEPYEFAQVNVTEKKTTGPDSKKGYFIVTDAGKEIEIDSMSYDRIDEMGVCYLSQTKTSGKVLNLYPGTKFQLEQK